MTTTVSGEGGVRDERMKEVRALCNKATEGPWFAADDEAADCPPHKGSGLALVDTGRSSDWPISRLGEWNNARYIAAADPQFVASLIDEVIQSRRSAAPGGRESGGILPTASDGVQNKWRTIDSAPKDGTEILVYFDKGKTHHIGFWGEGENYWIDTGDDHAFMSSPTHWKPLDAPVGSAPPSHAGSMPNDSPLLSAEREAVLLLRSLADAVNDEDVAEGCSQTLMESYGNAQAFLSSLKSPPTKG